MVHIIDNVLKCLPEKENFYIELHKLGFTLEDVAQNLYRFHEALKSVFGKHHFSVESQIIKSLHESVKNGVYKKKDASLVAIQLIGVFTKEHKKEISRAKKNLRKRFTRFQPKNFAKL
jgi:hypothetical protein